MVIRYVKCVEKNEKKRANASSRPVHTCRCRFLAAVSAASSHWRKNWRRSCPFIDSTYDRSPSLTSVRDVDGVAQPFTGLDPSDKKVSELLVVNLGHVDVSDAGSLPSTFHGMEKEVRPFFGHAGYRECLPEDAHGTPRVAPHVWLV